MSIHEDRIAEALEKNGGNQSAAATALGIARQSVNERIKNSERLQQTMREIEARVEDLVDGVILTTLNDRTLTGKPSQGAQNMAKWWKDYRLRAKGVHWRLETAAAEGAPAGGYPPLTVTIKYGDDPVI